MSGFKIHTHTHTHTRTHTTQDLDMSGFSGMPGMLLSPSLSSRALSLSIYTYIITACPQLVHNA